MGTSMGMGMGDDSIELVGVTDDFDDLATMQMDYYPNQDDKKNN